MAIEALDIQCSHCQSEEHFKLGHRDNEDTIEQAIDNFQGKTQIQIRSIIKKHRINHAQYGFTLFNCPECNTLYNPFTIELEYDDIMLFKPFHKCPQCNSTLIKAGKTIDSYTCKQCHQQHLQKK